MKVDNNNSFVSQNGNWIKIGKEERLDISKKTGPKRLFWKIFGGVVDFVNKDGSAITLRKRDVRRVLGSNFNFDDLQNLINKKATPSSPSEVKPEQPIEPPKAPHEQREPKNYLERNAALAIKNIQRPEAYNNALKGLRTRINDDMQEMVILANSEAATQEATFARMALAEHYIALKDATVEQLDQAELWARMAASNTNPYAQALLGVLMNSTKLIGS